jgi:hypothetical protein
MTEDTFSVDWSDEDQEFVGTCTEFPSLSYQDLAGCGNSGARRALI